MPSLALPLMNSGRWLRKAIPVHLSYAECEDAIPRTGRHLGMAQAIAESSSFPAVEGVEWEIGAVGNAEWKGVPLSECWRVQRVQEDAVRS